MYIQCLSCFYTCGNHNLGVCIYSNKKLFSHDSMSISTFRFLKIMDVFSISSDQKNTVSPYECFLKTVIL